MHQFVVTRPTSSVGEPNAKISWDLYPNPAATQLTLSGVCEAPSSIRFFNALGVKGAELPVPSLCGTYPLKLPDLAPGVWTAEWVRSDGSLWKKIVVR
jgi:hypothetical protein